MLLLVYLSNVAMGGSGSAPPPPPPADNPHLIWGVAQWNRKIRGRQIPDEVAEVIEEIVTAAPTAKPIRPDNAKIQLRAELKQQGIAWRKIYAEALVELMAKHAEEQTILVLLFDA